MWKVQLDRFLPVGTALLGTALLGSALLGSALLVAGIGLCHGKDCSRLKPGNTLLLTGKL